MDACPVVWFFILIRKAIARRPEATKKVSGNTR